MEKVTQHFSASKNASKKSQRSDREASRLEATLEFAGDAVIATDIQGRVEFLNPAAERLLGVDRRAAEGQPLRQLFQVYEKLGGLVTSDLVQLAIISGAAVGLGTDLVLITQGGGAPREIEGEISVRRSSTSIDGTVLTFRDVTARNSEEVQRREQQKLRAVSEFAGSVAHALNNLLTVILSHSEAIHDQFRSIQPVRTGAEEITRAAGEIRKLARELLSLSGGFTLEPVVVDLNALVESLSPRINSEFSGVALKRSLSPDLGTVLMDRGQMERIIMQMLGFARTRTPAGGTVELTTANLTVDENCRGRYLKKFVQLSVRDCGPIISDAALEGFFSRVSGPDSDNLTSNLNLFSIRTAVTMARGFFGIEQAPGGGANLVLSLPRYEEEDLPPESTPPRPASSGATVLLVEDDNAVRILLRNTLEKHGYGVIEARDGAEALEQAEWHESPIDLLITDIIMPRMDGRALAKTLSATRPGLKMLFISGGAGRLTGIDELIRDSSQLLTKPFSQTDLVARVQQILSS